jgi:hypothetical protein
MSHFNRREALQTAFVGSLASANPLALTTPLAADDKKEIAPNNPMTEQERVMACGFTKDEAECWVLTAEAAAKFFKLPKLHVMDDHEVAQAIHIIQNKLMGRPAYRKYTGKA